MKPASGPPASTLVCAGCGAKVAMAGADRASTPWRCSQAKPDDNIDHVLRRVLDARRMSYPAGGESNPFLRYRTLLHSYQLAGAAGVAGAAGAGGSPEAAWIEKVETIDRAVAQVEGRQSEGFRVTPFAAQDGLAAALGLAKGQLWVKDETGNVAGSHKARHLMGILLHLRGQSFAEPAPQESKPLRLAIASCGNAALAAAVVARAAAYPLDVFVPTWADPRVVEKLRALGAHLNVCERTPGIPGDPCYHRFQEAVRDGAVPFCCQGPDNGLTIEGGETLAWEMVDTLIERGERPLDRLFVQVGGGALASACAQGFAEAVKLGRIGKAPKLHAVQTAGGFPLARAYERLASRIFARLENPLGETASPEERADFLRTHADPEMVKEELRHAATHRNEFMWPWETEPKSLATGILDDETYDWLAIVEAMLQTGGYPIVVDEDTLREANEVGRQTTSIKADPTGTAGLAGLMVVLEQGGGVGGDRVGALFTGVER